MVSPMSETVATPTPYGPEGAYTSNSQIEMNASTAPDFVRPAKGARDNGDGDNGERSLESDVNEHGVRVVESARSLPPSMLSSSPTQKIWSKPPKTDAAVAAVGQTTSRP